MMPRFFLSIPLFFILVSGISQADPVKSQTPAPSDDRAIQRTQLVTEVEAVLRRWEQQTDQYTTKTDLNELQDLLKQWDSEVQDLSERLPETEVEALEQRSKETRRPGF